MSEPIVHFRGITVRDEQAESSEEFDISEFVIPGQRLVTLPEAGSKTPDSVLPVPGENTQWELRNTGIVATCHGYPKIIPGDIQQSEPPVVTVTPLIEVTANLMEARITLYPRVPPSRMPDQQLVQDGCERAGVLYGVDTAVVSQLLEKVRMTGLPVTDQIIARGKAPIDGKDAVLHFEVELGPMPGKLLADGSIDFRERVMFVAVSEDQLLARKIPATKGVPGKNLAGELVPARDGKDMQVKVSQDTRYCEEDMTVRATAAGVLTMVNDNTLRVSSQQRINGDVDFSTGNIRSRNAVEITGSIQPEFIVSARGNLLVGGNIQSASVNSHGNITVKGGILGTSSQVRIQGDADVNYIERGLLQAGGNIVIRASSYYSDITSAGSIICPDKAKIIGGEIVAGGSLRAGQIGSTSADPIRVAVGTDPRRYRYYQQLKKQHQELLNEIHTYHSLHGDKKQSRKSEGLERSLKTIEREISQFNLIPDTPDNSLMDSEYIYTKAEIVVVGKISARTVIRIGNSTMELKQDLYKSKIRLDPGNNMIIWIPL